MTNTLSCLYEQADASNFAQKQANKALTDADIRSRFLALHGPTLGAIAFKDFVANRDESQKLERANRAEMASLGAQISAAHERERLDLIPLGAAIGRATAAKEQADAAYQARVSLTHSQVAALENRRRAIARDLNGIPALPETLVDKPSVPKAVVMPTAPPVSAFVRALRRVGIGVDKSLDIGDTAEVTLEDAAFLTKIGAVERIEPN